MKTKAPRLQGGVAIVTGGGSGIGRALCDRLAAAGARVVVADIAGPSAEATAEALRSSGGQAEAATVDVRDAAAVEGLIERVAREHERLDWMFNNAGISVAGDALDMTLSDFDRTFDVNLRGVVHGVLPAYRVMARQGFGHIVNTASTAGLTPSPGLSAYSASKHAVVGLSLSLRAEAELHGVRVTAVCPGLIDTNMKNTNELRNLDRQVLLASLPFAMYPADACARDVLRGVLRNAPVIVTPGHARLLVWMHRTAPWLLHWLVARGSRQIRAAARRVAPPPP